MLAPATHSGRSPATTSLPERTEAQEVWPRVSIFPARTKTCTLHDDRPKKLATRCQTLLLQHNPSYYATRAWHLMSFALLRIRAPLGRCLRTMSASPNIQHQNLISRQPPKFTSPVPPRRAIHNDARVNALGNNLTTISCTKLPCKVLPTDLTEQTQHHVGLAIFITCFDHGTVAGS